MKLGQKALFGKELKKKCNISSNENHLEPIQGIVNYYKQKAKLPNKQRNALINAIAEYYDATFDRI